MSGASKPAKHSGRTQAIIEKKSAPRLPHERDESSDSQATAPRGVMKQAHADVVSGKVDTDRGKPLDETYQKQKDSASDDTPVDDGNKGRHS